MNSPSPSPENESRVTAYLLGELPPAEAKDFEETLADAPGLRELTDRLRQTIGLIKQASPLTESSETEGTEGPPLQLDEDRRKALLETLSSEQNPPKSKIGQSRIPWYWPVGIAAALMLSLAPFAYFPDGPQALRDRAIGSASIRLAQDSGLERESARFRTLGTNPSAGTLNQESSTLADAEPTVENVARTRSSARFAVDSKSNLDVKQLSRSGGRQIALQQEAAPVVDDLSSVRWGLAPEALNRSSSAPDTTVNFADAMSVGKTIVSAAPAVPQTTEKLVAQKVQREAAPKDAFFAQSLSEELTAESQELSLAVQEPASRLYRFQAPTDTSQPEGEIERRRSVSANGVTHNAFGDIDRDFANPTPDNQQDGLVVDFEGESDASGLDTSHLGGMAGGGGLGGGSAVGGGGGFGGRGGQTTLGYAVSAKAEDKTLEEAKRSETIVEDRNGIADRFGRTESESLFAGVPFGAMPDGHETPEPTLQFGNEENFREGLEQSEQLSLLSSMAPKDEFVTDFSARLDELHELEDSIATLENAEFGEIKERQLGRLALKIPAPSSAPEPAPRATQKQRQLLERAPQSGPQAQTISRGMALYDTQPKLNLDSGITPELEAAPSSRSKDFGFEAMPGQEAELLGERLSGSRPGRMRGSQLAPFQLSKQASAPKLPSLSQLPQLGREVQDGATLLSETITETRKGLDQKKKREKAPTPVAKPKPRSNEAPRFPTEKQTAEEPTSTFSLNVSDVSFKLASASLKQGTLPMPESIRPEEFINALTYHDIPSAGESPVSVFTERAQIDLGHRQEVLRIAVKTRSSGRSNQQALNLVILLDNSGSMERPDRQLIVRRTLEALMSTLVDHDRVSLITFARRSRLWGEGLSPREALDRVAELSQVFPEGGTNLESALDTAYSIAAKHFRPDGKNRVILFTDGAANLGNTEGEALRQTVERNRKKGIALDCFGIGFDGFEDERLETLTRNGDGRYAFLNHVEEVESNFLRQLTGALNVAAKNVKVQITFNPNRVSRYRQIGYAKHQLKKEQFRDNSVDAAELAAEEAGSALYLISPDPEGTGPVGTLAIRYQAPETGLYHELNWPLAYTGPAPELSRASSGTQLATAAALFAERLAEIPYSQSVSLGTLETIVSRVVESASWDPAVTQLQGMIQQARRLSSND